MQIIVFDDHHFRAAPPTRVNMSVVHYRRTMVNRSVHHREGMMRHNMLR